MTLEQYQQSAQQAAKLVDEKAYPAAAVVLQSLVESDLPAIDRSVMSVNVATVCDMMGHVDHALAWFDHGIALEEPLMRCFVSLRKADYLAAKGRHAEAAEIFQAILDAPYLTLNEADGIRQRLAALPK